MERHPEYGTMNYTEEGDEELAELYRLMQPDADGVYHEPEGSNKCPRCRYPEGTFACRVRHVNVNVVNLKAR